MASIKKILVGAGIGGGLIAGVSYLLRLKRTAVELESVTTLMVHSVDLKGITVRVDTTLKNPTRTGMKIKFPFVKLIYRDAVIGTSQVLNKDINIKPNSEEKLDPIIIQIPLLGIFSIGAGLAKSIANGEEIKMTAKTITTVDLGWKKLPYEKSDDLTLKKAA